MVLQKKLSLLLLLLLAFNWSCKKTKTEPSLSPEEQMAADLVIINDYIATNKLTATKTASGLHYVVLKEGDGGAKPAATTKVEVLYVGSFINGQVFDQTSGNTTIRFNLNQVIAGWTEGLQLMTRGQKNKLILPSALAYGRNPPQGIPANAVLIFDVTLVDF